jgi:hypothetical protein
MEVDWAHPEDVYGEQGLWQPAEEQVNTTTYLQALQAAQDRAAALAAAVAAGPAATSGAGADGSAADATTLASAAAAAHQVSSLGASSDLNSNTPASSTAAANSSSYLQKQVGLLMGFIKADSCPAITAAEEAALGIQMPRPLAVVHDYCPAVAAASAAAAAVAALVPGGGLTYSSSEEYPAAGTASDVTRVSFGGAERAQRGVVAGLERRVQQLRTQQEYEDGREAAFLAGGLEAAAAWMAAADAEAAKAAEDPNAWMDDFSVLPSSLAYARAGGSKAWAVAGGESAGNSSSAPAVVAACEVGLKINASMSAQRQDSPEVLEQQLYEIESGADPVTAACVDTHSERDTIASLLPRGMSARARENATLAYVAANRMQQYVLGGDFQPDDAFDQYYGVVPAVDGFWDRVARGEVGRGQGGFCVPEPRVGINRNSGLLDSLEAAERHRAIDAELR